MVENTAKLNNSFFSPKFLFRVLVVVFWTQNTVLNFVIEVIERMPIIGHFASFILPVFTGFLIVASSSYIFKRIYRQDILLYVAVILVILCTLHLYPDSSEYIFPEFGRIIKAVALFYLGAAYDHNESKRDLFFCSLLGVGISFLYQMYVLSTGRVLADDNMNTAYNVLPSVMYLIYWAFCSKKMLHWIVAIGGVLLVFVFGTRGPIIAIFAYLGICAVYYILKIENVLIKVFLILLSVALIVYISSQNRIIVWASMMAEWFGELGFSTRIFDFVIEEELGYASGRDVLTEKVWLAIKRNPFRGYGFMGDRSIVGIYVHNILLEMMCSFGIINGLALFLMVLLTPLVAINQFRKDHSVAFFLIMYFCIVFIKLFFSGSYVYDQSFYLLLGLCVGAIRINKINVNIRN